MYRKISVSFRNPAFKLESFGETCNSSGAEGRTRTDTRVASQQFLRLPRLPFRHFGCGAVRWCRGPESNWGHVDFQSTALPTELPRRDVYCKFSLCLMSRHGFLRLSIRNTAEQLLLGSDTTAGLD